MFRNCWSNSSRKACSFLFSLLIIYAWFAPQMTSRRSIEKCIAVLEWQASFPKMLLVYAIRNKPFSILCLAFPLRTELRITFPCWLDKSSSYDPPPKWCRCGAVGEYFSGFRRPVGLKNHHIWDGLDTQYPYVRLGIQRGRLLISWLRVRLVYIISNNKNQ